MIDYTIEQYDFLVNVVFSYENEVMNDINEYVIEY